MASETEQFDIALGHCTVRDGELLIDRADPEETGRWKLFQKGLATNLKHRPWFTGAWIVGGLALAAVFIWLLYDIYVSNPAAAPLVGVLGALGFVAVIVPLEISYRRSIRQRRQLRTTLADEFPLVHEDRIPLDSITSVAARSVTTQSSLMDGRQFLIHFRDDDDDATTYLGFPSFMSQEIAAARTVFEQYGIPITETVDGS